MSSDAVDIRSSTSSSTGASPQRSSSERLCLYHHSLLNLRGGCNLRGLSIINEPLSWCPIIRTNRPASEIAPNSLAEPALDRWTPRRQKTRSYRMFPSKFLRRPRSLLPSSSQPHRQECTFLFRLPPPTNRNTLKVSSRYGRPSTAPPTVIMSTYIPCASYAP